MRGGSVLPDRDLLLAWRPEQAGDRPALEVLVHEEAQEGTRYFLALVSPPAAAGALPVIDREITLLVDHSGSMAGPKWQACRWAVRRFLAGLRPTDTFHLGLFQSSCAWLAPGPLSGTDANRERALRFLEAHAPDGGTELGPALEQALHRPRSPGERARDVLLLTDAQVSDEARLLQLAETEAARPDDGRRLSLLCIDAAPKSAFVRDLAEAGGGVAVFLSSDPHQEDITAALDRVLHAWAQPLAKDVQLVVETRAEARTAHGGAGCTRSATRLGDLPAGRSLWASGAVSLFSEPVFRLCAGASVLAEVALDLASPPPPRPELRTLFGARQIARLERLAAGRYDAVERDAVLDALGYAGDPLRAPEPPPQPRAAHRQRALLPAPVPADYGPQARPASPEVAEMLSSLGSIEGVSSFGNGVLRFHGTAVVVQDAAVLAEGVAGSDLPFCPTYLRAALEEGDPREVDELAEIWVCVGQPTTPVVRVRLRELLALGGERPLNLDLSRGERVWVLLYAPHGSWPAAAACLSIELG